MKDDRGVFYYPFPANHRVRMYVREAEGKIWFRLYNADDDQLWEEHGWVPYDAIVKAREMYTGKGFDPNTAYDVNIAEHLIQVDKRDSKAS